jgi:hypothetical protein
MQRPGDFPPIYFVPGDSIQFSVELMEADGVTPHDLTGTTCEAEVRIIGSTEVAPIATFDITAPDSTGVLGLSIPAAETHVMDSRDMAWDLQVTYGDGTVRTLVAGVVVALRDVTA